MKTLFPLVVSLVFFFQGCVTTPDNKNGSKKKYNLVFSGYDAGIQNPDQDRRSYYRIFLDKVEAGRTTTGLESQEKIYRGSLESNRHLLRVEKWVLDKRKSRYIKLNNISQPKPNFLYFNIPSKGIVIIKMKTSKENRAHFAVTVE
jgi:hypothetical protein